MIKIALKWSYFCRKCKIFKRWGLRLHTPVPPAAGGLPPDPQPPAAGGSAPRPPHTANFWLRACLHQKDWNQGRTTQAESGTRRESMLITLLINSNTLITSLFGQQMLLVQTVGQKCCRWVRLVFTFFCQWSILRQWSFTCISNIFG